MAGIEGELARLYDTFVDWEGRLRREMPGILARLHVTGARRVLDCGCGTGRHVAALLKEGFDAHGADASEDMLAQARELTGQPERFHRWRMGAPPPRELTRGSGFDALICLGNVWPHITGGEEIAAAIDAFKTLLRRGGLLLIGLKAVAIRRETGDPYMPLLRREQDGRPLYFVRFVEFDDDDDDDPRLCQFHMLVGRGDADSDAPDAVLHRVSRARVWSPQELERVFREAGFFNVRVSGRLDDPNLPPATEDVFVHAFAP